MGCCSSAPKVEEKSGKKNHENTNLREPVSTHSNNNRSENQNQTQNQTQNQSQNQPKTQNEAKNGNANEIKNEVIEMKDDQRRHSVSEVIHITFNDLNSEELRKMELQARKTERLSELMEEQQKIRSLRHSAFKNQLASQSGHLEGLFVRFTRYALEEHDNKKMNKAGLIKCMQTFGFFDLNKEVQNLVWKQFDLEDSGLIDYTDFQATVAAFVASKDEDLLTILFQVFDIQQRGFLGLEDMARILLALNEMVCAVTGNKEQRIVYTKNQCIKQAKAMMDQYDSDEFKDNKISFDEFRNMMQNRTENDMMIENMKQPSLGNISFQLSVDIESNPNTPNLTPAKPPKNKLEFIQANEQQ